MAQLAGKVAVVTGAGTGIGRGIAVELGRRGASVIVHYNRSEAGARETVQMLEKTGTRAYSIQADLESVAQCQRLVHLSVKALGRVDVLVNNAAVSTEAPFLDVSEALWDQTVNVNLRAPFFCAQAAAREMVRQGGGRIVHVGSVHGLVSRSPFGAYAAAKGGLHALTRQMAVELAPYHISVNCVAPGTIEVERYAAMLDYDRQRSARAIPWGRVGEPQDVATVVAFLCSDDADFVTGQVVCVDGGATSHLPSDRIGSGAQGDDR
jgi:glucose 1-dehydrogenase/3-oxoacyl-[acyl-carrier protein] reductase